MKPNKYVGLHYRLTQPTENGQGIVIVNIDQYPLSINDKLMIEVGDLI